MQTNFSLKVDWSPRNQIETVLEHYTTYSHIRLCSTGLERNQNQVNGI